MGRRTGIAEHNALYQRRRDLVVEGLNRIGLKAASPKAKPLRMARVPEGYTSAEFTADLLEQVGVVVTPGNGYGRNGEGYVRLSLTIADANLSQGSFATRGWRSHKMAGFKLS